MSSTKLMYDNDIYKQNLKQSTSSLGYTLYPGKFQNCAKCRIELGSVGGNDVSLYSGNMVDLESELRGQIKPNSCNKLIKNPKLIDQPSCQMVKYPARIVPDKISISKCNNPNELINLSNEPMGYNSYY